jgi:hypothetical protein
MTDVILGTDFRIRIYANEYSDSILVGSYNIDNLAQLEYWLYTIDGDIKKYHKGVILKDGYEGLMVRDSATEYHINFRGSVNKTMRPGILKIDIKVSFDDIEMVELIMLESIITNLNLIKKPITNG